MERRYLAATIAMAATFALFSHAFSSGLLHRVHDPRATLVSEARCAAQTLRTRLLDKVNRSFGTGNAEEAQLRVEFNLPAPVLAAPAVPATPAVAPVPPVPSAKAVARQLACPTQRLVARTSRDYERAQAFAMKMQSKAMATQAKLMAVEARLTSEAMQREMRRAALAQVRANIAQAKSHPCNGARTVHVSSRSNSDGNMDLDVNDVDVNLDQLESQIEEQVSRSLRNTVRNF
jgi:hypothetical protein